MTRRGKKNQKIVVKVQQSQKKKKQKSKKKTKAGSSAAFSMKSGMAMAVCSVTNPFCPEALGSKWPDGSMTKTLPFTLNAYPVNVSTNASGNAAVMFLGGYYQALGSTVTGTTPTWAAPSQFATFPSTPYRYRLTSWGIRITNICPAMTAQGMIRIRLYSPITFAGLMNTGTGVAKATISDTFADVVYDIPLPRLLTEDVFVIPKTTGEQARLFTAVETNTLAGWVNPGWQVVQVGFEGCTVSANVAQISMFYHYEYVAAEGDAVMSFATKSPATNFAVQENSTSVLERVGQIVEGAASKVDALFESKAGRMAMSAVAGYATGNPSTALALYGSTRRSFRPPGYMPGMMVD